MHSTRAACTIKKSQTDLNIEKKLPTSLSIGHFWTNFGHVSQIPGLRF